MTCKAPLHDYTRLEFPSRKEAIFPACVLLSKASHRPNFSSNNLSIFSHRVCLTTVPFGSVDHHIHPGKAHGPGPDLPYNLVLLPLARLGPVWDVRKT